MVIGQYAVSLVDYLNETVAPAANQKTRGTDCMTTNRKPRPARGTPANRTQAQRQKLINFDSTGQLMQALWNYAQGLPVVIFDTTGSLLHGEETLKAITDTGASLGSWVLHGIDSGWF